MKGMLAGSIMASAIFSGACAHVSVGQSVLDSSFRATPIARDDVFVYAEGDSIPQHSHVALLDVRGEGTDEGSLLNKLREEAGKLGANAIIWGVTADPGFLTQIFGSSDRRASALAIYVPSLGRGGNDNR